MLACEYVAAAARRSRAYEGALTHGGTLSGD
jgi:hypothetical protein